MQQILLEIPLLGYIFAPEATQDKVTRFKSWMGRKGRSAIVIGAFAIGAYLEVSVNSDAGSLKSTCGHDCPRSQVDPLVLKQQVLGPIAFGVGALGLGLATYTFFATPTDGGATAGVAGRF